MLHLEAMISHLQVTSLIVAASFCIYWIALYVYRLTLHPLAKFPGPRFAACTYWYELYHDLIAGPFPGQGAYNIKKLHQRYGPIVRISPGELSVSDADWFDVLYKGGRRDKWAKNSKANGSPGSVASTIDGQMHKARRAPLTPFFSKRAVNNLEVTIRAKVDQMADGIDSQYLRTGKVLPLGVPSTALTLDVISDYCFGQSWRCLSAPEFAPEWQRTMNNLFEPVPVVKQFPWIAQVMGALPKSVLAKINPDMAMFQGAKDNVQRQVERIIAEYEDTTSISPKTALGKSMPSPSTYANDEDHAPRTIFHAVLDSTLPPSEKTVPRITDEAFVMIVAGGETTAKAITTTIFHLLSHPSWKDMIVRELDAAMPDTAILASSSELEKLPLLTAAIKESMRISAAVTNRVQVLEPQSELVYRQWTIPRGTPMSMSVPDIHHDAAIFREPSVFSPARFLGDEAKVSNRYYVPFHVGYRSCLGMNLAYTEIYLAVAALLRRFELELVDTVKERDVDTVRDCFVGMPVPGSKGVRVRVLNRRE